MNITTEMRERAIEFAKRPETTFPGVRRFLEIQLEDAAKASRGNVATDGEVSFFMDPECTAVADEIWKEFFDPLPPMSFFNGRTYQEGLRAYREANASRVTKGRGNYV